MIIGTLASETTGTKANAQVLLTGPNIAETLSFSINLLACFIASSASPLSSATISSNDWPLISSIWRASSKASRAPSLISIPCICRGPLKVPIRPILIELGESAALTFPTGITLSMIRKKSSWDTAPFIRARTPLFLLKPDQ